MQKWTSQNLTNKFAVLFVNNKCLETIKGVFQLFKEQLFPHPTQVCYYLAVIFPGWIVGLGPDQYMTISVHTTSVHCVDHFDRLQC